MARGAGGPSLELLGDPLLIPQNASYTHSPVKREACSKCVEFGVVWSPRQTWSTVFSDLSFIWPRLQVIPETGEDKFPRPETPRRKHEQLS